MNLSNSWLRIAAAFTRTALPCHCMICGLASDGLVCPPCVADFVKCSRHRCRICANPMALAGTTCARCLAHRPAFDATIAAADYAPPLDRLVLRLKFAAALPLAGWFAAMLHEAIVADDQFVVPDLLCPVPLGDRRLVTRGFNQALEIARPLARSLGIALYPSLAVRVADTRAQSSVAPSARAHNVRNAFALSPPAIWLVRGKHVGLVDDVMTSGHTLAELAALFKRSGAARVSNLVFARTPPS